MLLTGFFVLYVMTTRGTKSERGFALKEFFQDNKVCESIRSHVGMWIEGRQGLNWKKV
jgi:hypothetical protein